MTTLTVQVDNEQNAALLKKMLKALSFVEEVSIKGYGSYLVEEPKGSYQKLKRAIDKTNAMFPDIEDPSKWQKDIRDDWERNI